MGVEALRAFPLVYARHSPAGEPRGCTAGEETKNAVLPFQKAHGKRRSFLGALQELPTTTGIPQKEYSAKVIHRAIGQIRAFLSGKTEKRLARDQSDLIAAELLMFSPLPSASEFRREQDNHDIGGAWRDALSTSLPIVRGLQ